MFFLCYSAELSLVTNHKCYLFTNILFMMIPEPYSLSLMLIIDLNDLRSHPTVVLIRWFKKYIRWGHCWWCITALYWGTNQMNTRWSGEGAHHSGFNQSPPQKSGARGGGTGGGGVGMWDVGWGRKEFPFRGCCGTGSFFNSLGAAHSFIRQCYGGGSATPALPHYSPKAGRSVPRCGISNTPSIVPNPAREWCELNMLECLLIIAVSS